MPMPEVDPHDFEYMNHSPGTKPLGKEGDKACGVVTKEDHLHPEHGPISRGSFQCSREKGHMGRHEVIWRMGREVAASWADKPE